MKELVRTLGVTEQTFYCWKKKCVGRGRIRRSRI